MDLCSSETQGKQLVEGNAADVNWGKLSFEKFALVYSLQIMLVLSQLIACKNSDH